MQHTRRHQHILIPVVLLTGLILSFSCIHHNESNQNQNILKIGTTRDGLRSASLLGDSYLAAFAQISNPPLMTMNKKGKIEGLMVESYTVSADNTIWTFSLDPELFWSDGTKVCAQDAKFSIQLFAREVPYARWIRDLLKKVYVDENEGLVLALNQPYSRLSFDFTTYNLLPKHIWEKIEDPLRHNNTGVTVGCGPFFLERVDLNAGVIFFRKNPYWKGHPPEIDGIQIHLYNNKDVLALALEKGEVNTYYRYASSYPYPNIQRLRATENFYFIEEPQLSLKFLGFNIKKEPLSDFSFRNALSYAINYEEIIRLDLLGYGEVPNRGFIPRTMPHFKKTFPLLYDLKKAKNLLKKAGYGDSNGNGKIESLDGKDLKLALLIRKDYMRLAELIRDYIRNLSISIDITAVDTNTWTTMKDEYKYDLLISRTSPWGMFMHADWATGYFDHRRTGEGVMHTVDDPEFINLCDQILSTRQEKTLKELASSIQDYYAENLPAVALYWSRAVFPYQKKYTGWFANPLYGIYNIKNFLHLKMTNP